MTTSSDVNKFRYEGNGATDTFAFTGRIFATSDLIVEIILRADDSLVETLDLGSDYTVTINSSESASVVVDGGKVPSSTQDIQIRRSLAQTQTLDLPTGTRFPAVSVENALDKITALTQDLSEILDRTVTLSVTSSLTAPSIGSITADEVVIYDGTDFITDGTTTSDIQNAATNASNAASSASAASGSATLASQWASLTGAQVASTDYSAKEYAIGTTVPEGSAKDWAITAEDTLVDGSDYSAFHWAMKAEGFAESVNLPTLGAANTVLQVNGTGNALEYGVVDTDNIADNAITNAKIQDSEITNEKILDGELTYAKAAAGEFATSAQGDKADTAVQPADLKEIGVGQTWQNLGASRALDTEYTNSTGKPIMVAVTVDLLSSATSNFKIGGVVVASTTTGSSTAYGNTFSFIIPNGQTYEVEDVSGSVTEAHWWELR